MWSETLPSTCYILSDESSIFTSNGYKYWTGFVYVSKYNSLFEDDLKKLIFYFKARVLNL